MDSNGQVADIDGLSDKSTAQKRAPASPTTVATGKNLDKIPALFEGLAEGKKSENPTEGETTGGGDEATSAANGGFDPDQDEVADLFKGLVKKKKPKKLKEGDAADGGDEATPAADENFDPSTSKKKSKKPKDGEAADDGNEVLPGADPEFDASALKKKSKKPKEGEPTDGGYEAASVADGDFDPSTLKKKMSKKPKDGEATEGGDEVLPGADPEFDPSALKKKKKKKITEAANAEDFNAKLAEAGHAEDGEVDKDIDPVAVSQEGDLEKGTGIWQHSATEPISYPFLLSRFFTLVQRDHPDLLSGGSKMYKIPPPQCLREGNKKIIFANFADICKRMKRSEEHVTLYLLAELGTTGNIDGSGRLVIKARLSQRQVENIIRKYIVEYVTCKTCKSPDTELSKGENRLFFVTCNTCGSRRSVAAVKAGFRAQIGKRKNMKKQD